MSNIDDLSDFTKALSNIRDIVDKAADEVGDYLVETIRTRVRLGYGVSGDGQQKEKFRPLSASTIKSRQILAMKGDLFPSSNPKRSHLTATGDMMQQLTFSKQPGRITLFFGTPSSEDKAQYNQNGRYSRPFFYLTDKEIKAVDRILQKALDEYVDNIASNL
jgi:hypothetical protein